MAWILEGGLTPRFPSRLLVFAVVALLCVGIGTALAVARGKNDRRLGNGVVVSETNLGYQDGAAAGTGMVLSSSGEVLTNNHVIKGATTIRVRGARAGIRPRLPRRQPPADLSKTLDRAGWTPMRIHELTLATADLAAQSAFWGGTLELPVVEGSGLVEVSLRRSTIRFEQASPGGDPRYHFAMNIPPGSIEEAVAWLEERHDLLAFHGDPDVEEGATIVHTDRGASAIYFLDGGGNVVELIANDHLDDRLEAEFDARSLLEVAEIGVATTDTETTRAVIEETLSADVLWGGREGWLLTAIGDDHGVVIVAPVGRGWIPTGLPARPLPTTIVADAPQTREAVLPEGPYRIRAMSGA